MKPQKTLQFFLSVFLLLLVVLLYFPEDGIRVTDNFSLKFPTAKDFFSQDTIEYADISDIIDQSEEFGDTLLLALEEDYGEIGFDTVRANAQLLKKQIHHMEFPKGERSLLKPFFRSIAALPKNNKHIRIMHYGDSQIESDRMTAFIRNKLQRQFGGSGPGLISAVQPYDWQYSIKQTNLGDWHRHTLYGNRDTTIMHSRYGALASFSQFTPYMPDSIQPDTATYEASILLEEAIQSYRSVRDIEKCELFLGNIRTPLMVEFYAENELIDADVIPTQKGLKVLSWTMDSAVRNLEIRFSSSHSPEIYGIALDSETGLAMDNIALRGSSGLEFTKTNRELLKAMYKKLNPKLLILQFGGNVVPYIRNHAIYQRWFSNQLSLLHEILPNVPIIVIGPADMSVKEGNKYITHPNLVKVRDALKKAALESGAGYWDMFEAMGGVNSMPSWVFAQPSLASTDFVHFNYRGARIVAEMFYNALMYEYNEYVKGVN